MVLDIRRAASVPLAWNKFSGIGQAGSETPLKTPSCPLSKETTGPQQPLARHNASIKARKGSRSVSSSAISLTEALPPMRTA